MAAQQPNSAATMAAASTRVFAIPELVEDILEYLPAVPLYRLRRVNSTFHDTIKRKSCRAVMLLEPSPRLSLFRLMRLLQSPNIQQGIRPFKINLIHTIFGNRLLKVDVSTINIFCQSDIDRASADIENEVLPCGQMDASWREIRLDRGSMGLEIQFGNFPRPTPPYKKVRYGSEEVLTLGDLVDLAMVWLQEHSSQKKLKTEDADAAKRRRNILARFTRADRDDPPLMPSGL